MVLATLFLVLHKVQEDFYLPRLTFLHGGGGRGGGGPVNKASLSCLLGSVKKRCTAHTSENKIEISIHAFPSRPILADLKTPYSPQNKDAVHINRFFFFTQVPWFPARDRHLRAPQTGEGEKRDKTILERRIWEMLHFWVTVRASVI